ncbi:MAG: Lytic transglycosylase, catalytic [Acidobacteriaceae bacterium]|jgi:membrane-bound lytic murein transglycosylase D|nr:Lytic transglycosylase, catalytic [Acidobacteriaceae bacterium]
MRIQKLYLLFASSALILASVGCAHKQNAALGSKVTSPPPLVSSPKISPKPATEPDASVAKSQPASGPDQAGELIATVEKQYQLGQENYQAGHLEAAKDDFDQAFNLLLSSSLDIHSDERLEHEFDRVLDGVNGLELQALQQGDGFTEQKSEPAPIDEANEVTFPVDPNIKAKAAVEVQATHSDLPLMLTDPVASYINYFSTRGRGTLEHALERSGRYQAMIQRILKEEGVPQELIYLAQAESGFHPQALSRAGARGIWQFMASRAKGYGLERDWWVDDRQDPEKATRAAARHLKDLYNQFGDWYLAMAAYNSGPGTVQSAVKRTGYADFWELYKRNVLPKETRNYVPIIVAVTIMAKNPEQYGLDTVVPEKPVPYDTVKINYPVDLRLVAECVDSPAESLQDLNPNLLRLTTPKDQAFELHLPQGTKDKYTSAIAAVPPEMRVWWRYHKVGPTDTLASIARAYRTTPRVIAQANDLEVSEDLQPDSKLIIPVAPGRQSSVDNSLSYSKRLTAYKVRKTDTVESVADNFGVPTTMVRRWNHLKGSSLQGRRILYVHLPVSPNLTETGHTLASSKHKKASNLPTVTQSSALRHKVKRGETLYSIASSYKTTVTALKENNANVANLRPGMVLIIRAQ